ncbi:multicopper oxidase domain-containing protein [Pendulispora brunnea]|uniref:Multicopper oxidase domain-containing protein n=1 Tax=Pendulispora brunnea TaxID=2905690 RepID=A0ABZ2KLI8_9BACT
MRLLKWRPSKLGLIARRNRQEIIAAGLTRRELLKMGLISASGYLVSKGGLSAWASGGISTLASPPTAPFTEELVIPRVAQPTVLSPAPAEAPIAGEVARGNHLFWNSRPPQKAYELVAQPIQHRFHAQLPLNSAWGWGGTVPGPTFHARYGEPITVRMRNALPAIAQHTGFGRPEVSTHLHNLHNASASDGFPADFYETGLFKDHHYLNMYAGFTLPEFAPLGDPREALGTLWYHDHRVDFTAQNTYRGLSGFYLLFDALDSGDERDPNPVALRLPSGEFDVPLQIVDRVFDQDGQLLFDLFNLDGIIGDKFIVNGKIQPFFRVARRKYRFRLLNSGPSRFYEFFLSNGASFTHIANDGNLLPAPVAAQSVRLAVAERVDVIIDFSNYAIGDKIYLENRLEQVDGRGPTGNILPPGQGNMVLEFRVDRDAPDPSRVPAALRELPPVDTTAAAVTRVWDFGRSQGAWTVNNAFFDANVIRARPRQDTAEIWVLRNTSGGWSHPIHIHFEEFQVITLDGAPPTLRNAGRKDVLELGRANGSEARVFLRFRDMKGRYVMHCHNTVHEDHAMMIRWDIV